MNDSLLNHATTIFNIVGLIGKALTHVSNMEAPNSNSGNKS